jgi:hypothetical protein
MVALEPFGFASPAANAVCLGWLIFGIVDNEFMNLPPEVYRDRHPERPRTKTVEPIAGRES